MKIFTNEQNKQFELIFINEHKRSGKVKELKNDDYIDYKIWEDLNFDTMYSKYFPNTKYIKGNNPNIIFHGGCLGCLSQRKYGIDRCKGCMYFKFEFREKPNLFIPGEDKSTMSADDFKNFLEE